MRSARRVPLRPDPARGAPRVLLVEDLDALGADAADARERAAWLGAAGARATWLAVAGAEPRGLARDAGAPADQVISRREAGRVLREVAFRPEWDHVFLASPFRGGGALARWLPESAEWWPTGFAPEPDGLDPRAWLARPPLGRALFTPDGSATPEPRSLLGWATTTHPPSRHAGLPLWDGDVVLAPQGLASRAGEEALRAFARLADQWSGVDLVGWPHPSDRAQRRSRSLGIEMRVHHVGPPTRPAEQAWWRHASAALVTGDGPTATGIVLRALGAGCPLLWVGPSPPAAALAGCLVDEGCAWRVSADASEVASALESLLERGPEIEAAIGRGRALASRHDGADLTRRLAGLLGTKGSVERAA